MNPRSARIVSRLLASAAWLLLAPSVARAALIINGDFADSTDLAGWTSEGTTVGEPAGDFAQLGADGTYSRLLQQTFTLPTAPAILAFDFAFSTAAPFPGTGFPDSFTASLITVGGDFLDILVVDRLGVVADPSDGMEWLTGALPIDVTFNPAAAIPGFQALAGGTDYSGHISLLLPSTVLGQGATLYFELFDENGLAGTIAAIDNVGTYPAAVPMPATSALLAIGLAAFSGGRRRITHAPEAQAAERGTGHRPRPERLIRGRPLIGTGRLGENVADGAHAPSGTEIVIKAQTAGRNLKYTDSDIDHFRFVRGGGDAPDRPRSLRR